jgi:hypothetical protein
MAFNRSKADAAANDLSSAADSLEEAGLSSLATAARDVLDRLEAVLEGDTPMIGDTE